ncbi:MAG: hypothetical protein K1X88_27675, partial [Nannocystaceae bacterium]|nr:hypothetical protein [Nannocystaceae bacterium]
MRERSQQPQVLVGVIVASVLVHALLWPVSDEVLGLTWGSRPLPEGNGLMEVSLLDEEDPERDPDPEAPELAPGKLVQLDRVQDERPPERDTPYVSEFDNRAAKPTQAPNVHPQPGSPRSGNDGREGTAPQPSPATPTPPHALPLLPGTQPDDGPGEPGEAADQDDRGELALP